jgi:hypothetical protein
MSVQLKPMIMSTAELRAQISSQLEKVEDERFLKVVHSMLDTYVQELEDQDIDRTIENIPPSPDWKPMTEEAYMARLEEALLSSTKESSLPSRN